LQQYKEVVFRAVDLNLTVFGMDLLFQKFGAEFDEFKLSSSDLYNTFDYFTIPILDLKLAIV